MSREVLVKPTSAVKPFTLHGCAFDHCAPRYYIQILQPYKLRADVDKKAIFSHLEQGLGRVLSEIPILAGNAEINDETGRVRIDVPEDGGVVLAFRDYTSDELRDDWTGGTYAEIEQRGFPPASFQPGEVTPDSLPIGGSGPVLAVQASFIDGGLLICCSHHHCALDGKSEYMWFARLAKHVAAIASGCAPLPITPLPAAGLDRTLFSNGIKGVKPAAMRLDEELATPSMEMLLDAGGPKVTTMWRFSPASMAALKEAAASTSIGADAVRVSNNAAVCAFLWMHISQARELADNYETSCIGVPVDARPVAQPPVPEYYLGNASVVARAECSAKDLCSSSPEAFKKVAGAIVAATKAVGPRAIREMAGFVDSAPDAALISTDLNFFCGPDVVVSDVSRLAFNKLSFGPAFSQPGELSMPALPVDGGCWMLPRRHNGAIDVQISFTKDTTERLKKDREFCEVAECLSTFEFPTTGGDEDEEEAEEEKAAEEIVTKSKL